MGFCSKLPTVSFIRPFNSEPPLCQHTYEVLIQWCTKQNVPFTASCILCTPIRVLFLQHESDHIRSRPKTLQGPSDKIQMCGNGSPFFWPRFPSQPYLFCLLTSTLPLSAPARVLNMPCKFIPLHFFAWADSSHWTLPTPPVNLMNSYSSFKTPLRFPPGRPSDLNVLLCAVESSIQVSFVAPSTQLCSQRAGAMFYSALDLQSPAQCPL